MPSPFPGMNPYLEDPDLWLSIHGRLIIAIADFLSPQLRPKYFVAIEERIYETIADNSILVGIPDVIVRSQVTKNPTLPNVAVVNSSVKPTTVILSLPETVKERYLEVRRVDTKEVITAIEVLSPKNKRLGEGKDAYDKKRNRVLASSTHLVEIDLLRVGQSTQIIANMIESDYKILVSRSDYRPKADLYAFNLKDSIPSFPLPLRREDNEPLINLQTLIDELYDRASYDLVIDYSKQPVPKLSEADTSWLDEMLQAQGLR
jgi:hypothetical protein